MPLEHGNQLSSTAQCTVTGSGAALIVPSDIEISSPYITYVTPRKNNRQRNQRYGKYGSCNGASSI